MKMTFVTQDLDHGHSPSQHQKKLGMVISFTDAIIIFRSGTIDAELDAEQAYRQSLEEVNVRAFARRGGRREKSVLP